LKSKRAVVASFVSASGGVGKTKLSLMLAYHLRNLSQKVLFIDMDPTAGASLTVFSEEKYDKHVEEKKTLSNALELRFQNVTVDPSSVIVQAEVGSTIFDFVLPGERLINVVDELWKSSLPGLRFKKALDAFIPFSKYDYIIVDSAPFFDPRYTELSLHISDCIFIPLRPSLIDLKRTLRMVSLLKDEVEATEKGEKLRENMYAVFNHVPDKPSQVERRFVESFLKGEKGKNFKSSDLQRRYDALLTYAERLKSEGVKFMSSYVETSSDVERFPAPAVSKLPEKAEGFVIEASQILEELRKSSIV